MSPEAEHAALLLSKARDDQAALELLSANPSIATAQVGFHAQQAAEKAMKSVLASCGVDFPWTHDLQLLLKSLESAGVELPAVVIESRRLSPWAVEFRYGEAIGSELDREAVVALVSEVLNWAERIIADVEST